jgi:hypothetical protein
METSSLAAEGGLQHDKMEKLLESSAAAGGDDEDDG